MTPSVTGCSAEAGSDMPHLVRPAHLLRVWISEGLTQADSKFSGLGILMSIGFYRESPGKFDSGTLSRKSLSRWTGRICSAARDARWRCCVIVMKLIWTLIHQTMTCIQWWLRMADGLSGKDKGGPSKGGFLNNILFLLSDQLFIYTYHYLYYTHIDPYMKITYCSGDHL